MILKTIFTSFLLSISFFLIQAQTGSTSDKKIIKYWKAQNEQTGPSHWKAAWIWKKGENSGMDLVLLARKSFTLRNNPEEARLFITADNNYELYINGTFVNRGPVRCQPHHQSYDILEISSCLQPGENVLAIRALHQGRFGAFNLPPRPGILAQVEITSDGKTEIISTDNSWKVKKPEGTSLSAPVFGELADFRKEEPDWKELGFDDRQWQQAEELLSDTYWPWPEPSPKAMPATVTFPWETLVARDLPYLAETNVKAVNLSETGEILDLSFNNAIAEGANGLVFPAENISITGIGNYKDGKGPLIIQNSYPKDIFSNQSVYSSFFVFDFGELMHGYPHLELEGNPGTMIELIYVPRLIRGKIPFRTDISSRPLTDRIILGKGRTVWDAIEMKYLRYLLIAVRNTDQSVKLYYSGLKRADYPFSPDGRFLVEDPELQWLWNASVNTLKAVTTDAFTDNYRERLQYAQTSYYASRASYAAFGDSYLQRRYLHQIAQEQQSDGILPASAPVTSYRGGRFLDGTIFWILGLHDYLLHSGDTGAVRALLPIAEKAVNRLKSWENNDGIIENPPYPYWIDHADVDRYGANFSFNALYLLTQQSLMNIYAWTGDRQKADAYSRRMEKLKLFMRSNFWDNENKLFADTRSEGLLSKKFTEQSNSLAIVAGIATPEQQNEIITELVRNKSARLIPATLFMHYVAEALFMTYHSDDALAMMKDRYRHMRLEGSQTLWEEWGLNASKRSGVFRPEASRSDVQAEQTFLAYSLTYWLLGINPVTPGMKNIVIRYNPCSLAKISGSMPTPHGIISVSWEKSKKGTRLEVVIPARIQASLDVSALTMKKNIIIFDGIPGTLSKDFRFGPGTHVIEFL